MRIRHALEYVIFRGLLLALSGLTPEGAARLGAALGSFAFHVLRLRRRVTLENLAGVFPDWSRKRRHEVALACYRSFGITFLELFLLPGLDAGALRRKVKHEDPGIYDRAREEGRGAVLLTGHIGNWEYGGAVLPGMGYPTSVLVRRQKNQRVDTFVTRARESSGGRVIYADRGLRPVLRALRANEFVAILSDQDAGRSGVFVPFFGRPASTPLGPVRFARLAQCPIIVGLSVRQEDGTYLIEMPTPLRVRTDLPAKEAEVEATQRFVALLEDCIRRHPEQWFWMHRRWKTRPQEAVPGPPRAERINQEA